MKEEDSQEYLTFLASREDVEAWHQSVNPEIMRNFFEKALPNWRARNQFRPTPKLDYLINYAEEWLKN